MNAWHRDRPIPALLLLALVLGGACRPANAAESYLPCTLEQYDENAVVVVPNAEQVDKDVKLAYRLGGREAAVAVLCRAAAAGVSQAAYILGEASDSSTADKLLRIEQSDERKVFWLTKAAVAGHGEAAMKLFAFYALDKAGPGHMGEVLKWLEVAAQAGLARAQVALALEYLKGGNVKRDLDEAKRWAERAREQGHPRAEQAIRAIEAAINAQ